MARLAALRGKTHVAAALNVGRAHTATQAVSVMADEHDDDRPPDVSDVERGGENGMAEQYRTLTQDELNALAGEELPERAAMSLVNANLAIPVNAAVAANVLSDGAIAYADATQDANIDQSNL